MTNPIAVPVRARATLVRVVEALLRSTARAPRATHSPLWIGRTSVTTTASASARPVRRLLITVIERVDT